MTDLNAKVDKSLTFEFEDRTYVYESCGVQFKGNFYIYGGYKNEKTYQISKVEDCTLKRIGSLPFSHMNGACPATHDQLFLCFDFFSTGSEKLCRVATEPTGPFSEIEKSNYSHMYTRSATNHSKSNHWYHTIYFAQKTLCLRLAVRFIRDLKFTKSMSKNGSRSIRILTTRDHDIYV